jgi:hypothetical protein
MFKAPKIFAINKWYSVAKVRSAKKINQKIVLSIAHSFPGKNSTRDGKIPVSNCIGFNAGFSNMV